MTILKRIKNSKGMTLMELIIAIVFMSIIVLGLLSALGYSFNILGSSKNYMESNYIVQEDFEENLLINGIVTGSVVTSSLDITWSTSGADDFTSTGSVLLIESDEDYLSESFYVYVPISRYK